MENFSRREDVSLRYSPHRQFPNSPNSTKGNLDLDFGDVFGGPPRRVSMQEMRMRYSFSESVESEQAAVLPGNSWSGFDEKSVFGEENFSRRSYQNDDFFGDIFGGDDSKSYSSPTISREVFGSSPGSRILIPARPLPPKAEPFSTSIPSQFSLPAKLTKAMDFPAFASENPQYRSKDGSANEASYAPTNVSLSRFSSQTTKLLEETRKDQSFYRQSSLPNEVSLNSEELLETKSDEKDGEKLRNNSENVDASTNSFQFHFSIYKWAGKGMPSLTPVMGSNKSKSRSRYWSKKERCSSSNGRIHCDNTHRDSPEAEDQIIAANTEAVSSKVKDEKQDERCKASKMKSENTFKETRSEMPESENLTTAGHPILKGESISNRKTEEEHAQKPEHQEYLCEQTEKGLYTKEEHAQKPEQKLLSAFFNDETQGQGNATDGEEYKVKVSTAANENVKVNNNAKKTNSKGGNSIRAEGTNASLQGSAKKSGDALGKSAVKGKVREFVKIFNQETSAKPKIKPQMPSQSSRWKDIGINGTENEFSKVTKKEEKVHAPNTKMMPDASRREDDNLKADNVKQDADSRSSVHKASRRFTNEKNAPIFSDLLPNNHEAKVEKRDKSFQGHFLVEELPHILDKDLQTGGECDDFKGLDVKIQQWSNGRKGNIRSLLSTLQLVLWPESGWKPVPLVDIIEGSAVKRAYQKALLCLHPDKLQQKGAASHQKYMAEKVFDILQEAWDHFNSLGAI